MGDINTDKRYEVPTEKLETNTVTNTKQLGGSCVVVVKTETNTTPTKDGDIETADTSTKTAPDDDSYCGDVEHGCTGKRLGLVQQLQSQLQSQSKNQTGRAAGTITIIDNGKPTERSRGGDLLFGLKRRTAYFAIAMITIIIVIGIAFGVIYGNRICWGK